MTSRTKAELLELLLRAGVGSDVAHQYTDAMSEYLEATDNIDRNGLIVQHPRTLNPIDNPYMPVRDRALKKLTALRFRIPEEVRDLLWS